MIPYMAPELINHSGPQLPPFSKKSDIYSLGVLLWELSSGNPPFKAYDEKLLIMNICQGLREKMVPDTPPDYYNLYTACWNGNPQERPIIEKVYDKLNCISKNNEKDVIKNSEESEGNVKFSILI